MWLILRRRSPKVLGVAPTLTQNSYRVAVAGMIRSLQVRHSESDQDTADRVGCSAATIGNARNEKGDLSPVTLLRFGKEYGLDAIAPVMVLIGAKAAPVEAVCSSDREMPMHVAEAQLFLTRSLSDNDQINDEEVLDGAAAIENGGQVFDTLRWRLNGLRLKGRVAR